MSTAPGDMGSNLASNNYGDSVTPATPVTKRAPVYRRAFSLEQSQHFIVYLRNGTSNLRN